jgi:predicted AlkP superfamily pyrophosphatase or phosphodiesterase
LVVLLVLSGIAYFLSVKIYSISDITPCIEKILRIDSDCAIPVNLSSSHVVLIAVDAFGWSTWQYAKEYAESTNKLAKTGDVFQAKSTKPSTTRFAFPAMLENDEIFSVLEKNNLSFRSVGSEGFFNFTCIGRNKITVNNGKNITYDRDVAAAARSLIRTEDINFIFIHVSVDSTCHEYGPYSDESLNDIASTDRNIGEILQELSKNPAYADTIVILTADHGCHATAKGGDHGTAKDEDMLVPVIFSALPKGI